MNRINRLCIFVSTVFVLQFQSVFAIAQTEQQKSEQQTPGYKTIDFNFRSHDDLDLFGRLVLPKSKPPRAIVVYVQTAEGATVDMKRPLGGGKTFNYYDLYRDKLTSMDVGFFSYEGRGIRMGDQPPRYETIEREVFNTSTLENKVRDLLTAIATLKKQDNLSDTPVFLMGASEGTLLAVEAAARKPELVDGLVLYGVMARNLRHTFRYIMSGGDFLRYRSLDSDHDGTITKAEWEKVVKNVEFAKADLNSDGVFTVADVEVATKKYIDAIENDDYAVLQQWAKTSAAVALPDGWFEDHFKHAEMWSFVSKLDIPIGCFHGDMDRMTPIASVKELESKAKRANKSNMEFRYFDNLDHSLNIVQFFLNGEMPAGHKSIFEFVDRIATKK